MTFADGFFLKISFRNYDNKFNVNGTPLLKCWIGQFVVIASSKSLKDSKR